MENRPIWLDEYADILNKIRNKLVQISVVEESTFRYAIVRLFARATLSMCEIYTLMNNGYPEGAFALSRQIYETIVLMDYLTKHKNDEAMIERYFDDIEITKIKIQIEREKYAQKEVTVSTTEALNKYAEKYPDFCNSNNSFSDYWWIKKGCKFAEIAQETNFPKDYMYKQTSSIIHLSSFNSTVYVLNEQNRILIGDTYDGIEEAGWYSMLCFDMAVHLLVHTYDINCSDLILKCRELVTRIRNEL